MANGQSVNTQQGTRQMSQPNQEPVKTNVAVAQEQKAADIVKPVEEVKSVGMAYPSEAFNALSIPKQFKFLAGAGLEDVIRGIRTPQVVRQTLATWFQSLPAEARSVYRQDLTEDARYILRQAEDIMNEIPVLFM